ncbi:MAG: flagellar motor protein MotB [Elusimicrobia bacterium]|nr:flagellar motor protein MotB [Elusimicrobiota bacterium]
MIDAEDENDLENQLNKGALWAVTYGDLMSYLMLFFLLMFSFSMSEEGISFIESLSEVQKTFGGEENKELLERKSKIVKEEELAKDLQEKFGGKAGLDKFTQVELSEEKIKITLREAIVFDPGEIDLKPTAKTVLHEVAEFVGSMPNRIVVEGHTDNIPVPKGSRFVSNWVVSMARAYRVLKYFSDEEKIPAERLACVGYGEHQPIADNTTPEGRAKNRRIEITLVRTK